MKSIAFFTFLLFLLLTSVAFAQAPQAINYQAVARDNLGKPIPSKPVAIQISILDGSVNGNTVYAETHQKTTNQFGLFMLAIGEGSVQSGSFAAIDWAGGDKFLKVNIDNTLQGTTQLLSVPYALYAAKAKEGQTLSVDGNQLSISEGNSVTLPASGGGDNWGNQAVQTSGNALSGNGTGGSPLALAQQGAANGQVLKWDGAAWVPALDLSTSVAAGTGISVSQNGAIITVTNSAPDQPVSITGTGATTVTGAYPNFTVTTPAPADNSPTNEIQTLSLNNNTLSLSSGGGSVTLPMPPAYIAGAGINITGTTVTNTGDTNPSDDITTTSQAGGDLSGPFSNLQIGANTIGTNEITNGSIQTADLVAGVIPTTLPPSGPAGGDLSGAYPNPTVAKIQGKPVATTTPVDGQVLRYNGTTQQWEPVASSSLGWSLTGNSGTDTAMDFIGTTDDVPVSFRVNGTERMRLWGDGRLELFGENTTNTFVGRNSGVINTLGTTSEGVLNSFFGTNSGYYNTTGQQNSFFGAYAGYLNNTSGGNSFFGSFSGYSNYNANGNSFFGNYAGFNNGVGSENCFFGSHAGYSNINGINNGFFGYGAGYYNTTGHFNNFFGHGAGYSNTTGSFNNFFGYEAGYSNTTGDRNSFFGDVAGRSNSTGRTNSFFGEGAGFNNSSGDGNSFFGYNAGKNNKIGKRNTCIGYYSEMLDTLLDNTITLGNIAIATASNSARIGNTSITSIGGQVNWTAFSDARFKTDIHEEVKGLDFIRRLRPVTYQYDITKLDDFLGTTARRSERGDTLSLFEIESREKASSIRYTGFIAQEVEQAARELGFDFSGVDVPDNEHDLYGLRYAEFTVPLVKAVQEQQVIIEQQQKQLEALQEQLLGMAAEVKALKTGMIKPDDK